MGPDSPPSPLKLETIKTNNRKLQSITFLYRIPYIPGEGKFCFVFPVVI